MQRQVRRHGESRERGARRRGSSPTTCYKTGPAMSFNSQLGQATWLLW
jgi:hypothetical protein